MSRERKLPWRAEHNVGCLPCCGMLGCRGHDSQSYTIINPSRLCSGVLPTSFFVWEWIKTSTTITTTIVATPKSEYQTWRRRLVVKGPTPMIVVVVTCHLSTYYYLLSLSVRCFLVPSTVLGWYARNLLDAIMIFLTIICYGLYNPMRPSAAKSGEFHC